MRNTSKIKKFRKMKVKIWTKMFQIKVNSKTKGIEILIPKKIAHFMKLKSMIFSEDIPTS